jgi:hypothetical protein
MKCQACGKTGFKELNACWALSETSDYELEVDVCEECHLSIPHRLDYVE